MKNHKKYDLIVEAVHYKPAGEIEWVRAYERRGPAYSDHVIIPRQEFILKLKAGKKACSGQRVPLMAGTFQTALPISIREVNGKTIIISEGVQASQDKLVDVPVI